MANKNTLRKRQTKIRTGGAGVISSSPKRNMQMRVLHNTDANGRKDSMTVHEPIRKDSYVKFANHKYMREDPRGNHYRQWKSDSSVPTVGA